MYCNAGSAKIRYISSGNKMININILRDYVLYFTIEMRLFIYQITLYSLMYCEVFSNIYIYTNFLIQ